MQQKSKFLATLGEILEGLTNFPSLLRPHDMIASEEKKINFYLIHVKFSLIVTMEQVRFRAACVARQMQLL